MKTETHYIYWTFSELAATGVHFIIFNDAQHKNIVKNPESWVSYNFVRPIKLRNIDKEAISKQGVAVIDKEIGDLQMQINQKQEKKQQLLALEDMSQGDDAQPF